MNRKHIRFIAVAGLALCAAGCEVIGIFGAGSGANPAVNTPTPTATDPPAAPPGTTFVRGDANMNGIIDEGDILQIGEHLYAADALTCEDAADFNDDGKIDLTDAILVGRFVSGQQSGPPNAWPEPGTDPTADELDCHFYDSSIDPSVVLDKLIITDRATLEVAGLSFENVMNRLAATSGVPGADPLSVYQQWWTDVAGASCLNSVGPGGAPNDCDRVEGFLGGTDPFDVSGLPDNQENKDSYAPIAAVNRLDLAPADWSNCGEFRVLYGKRSLFRFGDLHDRNLILFEARVPNPTPGNPDGCRPLVDRWNELACEDYWFARGASLRQMFILGGDGLPPIIHADHFRSGRGQIRTSTFMNQGNTAENTWVFREFEIDTSNGMKIEQVTVKNSARPERFNTLSFDPFYYQFVNSVDDLAADNYLDIGLGVFGADDSFNAAIGEAIRSTSRSANFYDYVVGNTGNRENPQLDQEVANAAQSHGLTSQNIFDRATALTCSGCHANEVLPTGDLGGGVTRPVSLGFHHINEFGVLSPGMRTVFLPARQAKFDGVAGPASCE